MIKEPVHSHWVPEGAVGGLREIYFPEDGIKIIHQFQYIPEPEKSDDEDSNKENVPPEHPYKETSMEREIFGGSDSEEDPNNVSDWRMGVLRAVTPESLDPVVSAAPYPEALTGQLSQSFCDTLPDYPEGHFITRYRNRLHDASNYYGTKHGPYCSCRGRAEYTR